VYATDSTLYTLLREIPGSVCRVILGDCTNGPFDFCLKWNCRDTITWNSKEWKLPGGDDLYRYEEFEEGTCPKFRSRVFIDLSLQPFLSQQSLFQITNLAKHSFENIKIILKKYKNYSKPENEICYYRKFTTESEIENCLNQYSPIYFLNEEPLSWQDPEKTKKFEKLNLCLAHFVLYFSIMDGDDNKINKINNINEIGITTLMEGSGSLHVYCTIMGDTLFYSAEVSEGVFFYSERLDSLVRQIMNFVNPTCLPAKHSDEHYQYYLLQQQTTQEILKLS